MVVNKELKFWLGFSYCDGIGPLRFKLLTDYFGSAKLAWEASENKLREIGLGEKLVVKFHSFRKSFDFEKIKKELEEKQITVLTQTDLRYPKLLRQIPDPPIVLYVKGKINDGLLITKCVGVVGTRRITSYGREVTRKISKGLASAGVTVVSGMAYGVDTVAHESAIESGGKTVAVLGCGVDIIYPRANEKLYFQIVEKHGAVISEFPPGRLTAIGLFPSRNRIISGLSLGTVVTEGASDSGALITAKCAVEQGREVFAVPGPITSMYSDAPTILLKQGARLVTDAQDILEELKLPTRQLPDCSGNEKREKLSSDERKIIELLEKENLHFDELVRKSGLPVASLGKVLTQLEMKSFITHLEDGLYGLSLSYTSRI